MYNKSAVGGKKSASAAAVLWIAVKVTSTFSMLDFKPFLWA